MPALFDTYRFTANDGVSDTSVSPIVSTLRRRWEREGNTRAYRLKLANKLLFKGADYEYFRAIYDTGTCTEVTLLIENYCGGEWVTWYEGIIPVFAGDYNASRCQVVFDVKPNDLYECAQRAFEDRKNWLEYATPTTIKATVEGVELETITCTTVEPFTPTVYPELWRFNKSCWGTGENNTDDPDPALAWRPLSHVQDYNFLVEQVKIETTWVRETIDSATAPAGNGWINISGTTWVRPANLQNSQFLRPPQWPPPDGFFHYIMTYNAIPLNAAPISNGRKLSEILEALVDEMDCGFDQVVSNFFGINPDATNPSNGAYTYALANFQHVFFFQKSDIVRASASNDATRFTFSLKEFWNESKLINVFYSITVEAGVKKLRIEHYTYWEGANGLDLTTLDGGKYIAGLNAFGTDRQIPNFESFSYQESYRERFRTKKITYPAACANTEGDERTANQMCADFGGLVENPDAGLEGFFLMATVDIGGGEYLINTLGGEANGAFSWEKMLPALWADGRFHEDATANVAGYTVNSVARTREQPVITIKFCCSDQFDPSELVNTQLGWGEVKSAEQDVQRGTLKLTLLQ